MSEQVCKLTQSDAPDNNIKVVDDYLSDLTELLKGLTYDEEIHLFDQGVVALERIVIIRIEPGLTIISKARE